MDPPGTKPFRRSENTNDANDQSVSEKGPTIGPRQDEKSGAEILSPKTWCVLARVYVHSEETEFGASKGGAGTVNERNGSHHVHSRCGTQSARTLHCVGARRSREGLARCAISHRPRRARCGGCGGSQAGPLEVRRQTPEINFEESARLCHGVDS